MKIFITGASGLFGSRLAELAFSRGNEVYSGYLHNEPAAGTAVRFDLLDKEGISDSISQLKPDVIVHSAALTDVDRCERERDLAFKINVEGTRSVADAAQKAGSFLIYISTDYVFDGERGMYRESEKTNPLSYYGLTKMLAEQYCQGCIARTCVIYGNRPASGKVNFALWLLDSLRAGKEVRAVLDQFITPTLNTNLAAMVLEAAERRLLGVYHLAGATRISRYDYARKLAQAFELDCSLILPSEMKDLNWTAKRPKDSSLDTTKAREMLANRPLTLDESLLRLKEEICEVV